jgi:hypothetical protein
VFLNYDVPYRELALEKLNANELTIHIKYSVFKQKHTLKSCLSTPVPREAPGHPGAEKFLRSHFKGKKRLCGSGAYLSCQL